MSENSNRKTAQIYQFPKGGRRALLANAEALNPTSDVTPARPAKVALGGSLYHEDAIQEAELARKR